MSWLRQNADALQALAAIATLLVALGALIGVKVQIDATDRLNKQQSAREIYREYLSLSITNPAFSAPNYCALETGPPATLNGYSNYLEYTLYTAELMMQADDGWDSTFQGIFDTHTAALCADEIDPDAYDPAILPLLSKYTPTYCATQPSCDG